MNTAASQRKAGASVRRLGRATSSPVFLPASMGAISNQNSLQERPDYDAECLALKAEFQCWQPAGLDLDCRQGDGKPVLD
ncbi:hypothetical protein AADZ90_008670 [Aestuariibius sp. 2305UL40-4]|uniref:hypothetical protein n=1 Tax=Aestuariibius violaceus TaxID=3234132 RepID=UPI00345F04A0